MDNKSLKKANLSFKQKCDLIDKTPLSSDFSWTQIEKLVNYMGCYVVRKKDFIFVEGDPEPYLVFIVKGKFRILKKGSTNRNKEITKLGPGQFIGEMTIIDGEPRSASVQAVEDSFIFILTKDDLYHLIDEVPRIATKLIMKLAKAMSQRLRISSGLLVESLEKETYTMKALRDEDLF